MLDRDLDKITNFYRSYRFRQNRVRLHHVIIVPDEEVKTHSATETANIPDNRQHLQLWVYDF